MNERASNNGKVNIRGPLLVGLFIVGLFFGTLGAWALLVPLESAAIVPGVVSVDTKRKTIQHLEGGIVSEIRVRDGDEVKAGDVLIVLDDTQPSATLELVRGRYLSARALEARLIAERDSGEAIAFPDELLARADEPKEAELIGGQHNIFAARRSALENQTAILKQRIAQYRAEIVGLKELFASQNEQIDLIVDEIGSHKKLFKKGMSGKSPLRGLQKELAEVRGERSQNKAVIARIGQNIAEVKLQISDLRTNQLNEVVQQLRDVQAEIFGLTEQIHSAEDVLNRTVIRAPITGTIVGRQVNTVGGVISPGEALLDIVPKGERLIVEASVSQDDIDIVEPGLGAQVRLTALSQRNSQPVDGKVLSVSADRLTDKRTGNDYYLARVALTGDIGAALNGVELYPGMHAEVMIVTGGRTPFDYFIQPITQSFNRAFREN